MKCRYCDNDFEKQVDEHTVIYTCKKCGLTVCYPLDHEVCALVSHVRENGARIWGIKGEISDE